MEALPWISAIVIALIIGGSAIAATGAKHGIKGEVKKAEVEAMKTYADATNALTERLESIDARLAKIEKTLTEIP